MRNSSPPCERGEGYKAAGGFRAAEDSGPYGQDSSHSVGADVPIRPEFPAPWLPPWGPIPLIKGKCPEGTKGIGILARR